MDQPRFKHIIKLLDFDKLTDWEEKFVESCDRMMKSKGDISERMEEILERIYREQI